MNVIGSLREELSKASLSAPLSLFWGELFDGSAKQPAPNKTTPSKTDINDKKTSEKAFMEDIPELSKESLSFRKGRRQRNLQGETEKDLVLSSLCGLAKMMIR